MLPPINDAFMAISPAILAELMLKKNQKGLRELLLYHILPGVILEEDFQTGEVETLSGEDIFVSENPLRINDANILDPDLLGCNGVYHVIDEILVPYGKTLY